MINDRTEPMQSAGRGQFAAGVLLGLSLGFAAGHLLVFGRAIEDARAAEITEESTAWESFELSLADTTSAETSSAAVFSTLEVASEPGRASLSPDTDQDDLHYFPESMPRADREPPQSFSSQLAFLTDDQSDGALRVTADATGGGEEAPQALEPNPSAAPIDKQTSLREELARRVIREELPDATAQERDVWYDVLLGLPIKDVRGILQMRKRLGSGTTFALQSECESTLPAAAHDSASSSLSPAETSFAAHVDDALHGETIDALHTLRDLNRQNLLNRDTIAYKRLVPLVAEATTTDEGTVDLGIRCLGVIRDMTSGPLRPTERSLDVGIDPSAFRTAFFQVRRGDEVRFTRAGRLGVDGEGRLKLLATEEEWLLEPPIFLPSDAAGIAIETDGRVQATSIDGQDPREAGRIAAVLFLNPDGLRPAGGGLYEATGASGRPTATTFGSPETGELMQGYVESSNVNESAVRERLVWLQSMTELLAE